MISLIEQAIIARLKAGLGVMVSDAVSWNALGTDLGVILQCLPGAFITLGGITDSRPHDTRRTRFKVSGWFSVYVADTNLRSNEAARHGGARLDEPGCYRLIRSVRRLLTGQDFGLDIGRLQPGTVRPVAAQVFNQKATAVYECQFSTSWFEDALDNGRWPEPATQDEPDYDFVLWRGKLEAPWPEHLSTHGTYVIGGEDVAEDVVPTGQAQLPDNPEKNDDNP